MCFSESWIRLHCTTNAAVRTVALFTVPVVQVSREGAQFKCSEGQHRTTGCCAMDSSNFTISGSHMFIANADFEMNETRRSYIGIVPCLSVNSPAEYSCRVSSQECVYQYY